ncbi:Uncharacterized protein PBTT_04282 [Plasmodiophora brassicae]|uniref:Uncharacterized protein n=1 Tax=Plasmodiophora brassicae TaxID=37360 RepID=A0A0G4IGL4_PLABS|nr:hypothetical protein PBRA_000141 [Plasmodiophora brassicae]SPQ96706.1 unnamed protein product [Plasmodiophora brassicae]
MSIMHPQTATEEPSPLLLLLQAELKLAQRDGLVLDEPLPDGRRTGKRSAESRDDCDDRSALLAKKPRPATRPRTIETCRMLSEDERRAIINECYEVDPASDQLDKIRSISPVLASLMTPDELQTCDRVPKMCLARQIQLYRFVRTFASRLNQVSSTASAQTMNALVQYFAGQTMRLLEDDIAIVSHCRSVWMQRKFEDVKAARFARQTRWAVSEREPPRTSGSAEAHPHDMVFTRVADVRKQAD